MWRLTFGLASILVLVGCTSFSAANRGAATQDQYALGDQVCVFEDGQAVARGNITNHSGETKEFGVVVRFFDGDLDVGRPQNVNLDGALEDGDTRPWEARVAVDDEPADLRCNVIQVVIGDNVALD